MAKNIKYTRKQLETAKRMIDEYRDLDKQFNYHLDKVCFYFHPSTPNVLYLKASFKHYEDGEMYADNELFAIDTNGGVDAKHEKFYSPKDRYAFESDFVELTLTDKGINFA
jgi:hypothetical protein